MKNVFLLFILCGVFSMTMAQETKSFTRFEGNEITAVNASVCWDIEISQGGDNRVMVTFPARFEKQLLVQLSADGELKLGFRNGTNLRPGEKISAVVVCSSLNRVELSGACQLLGNGQFSAETMKFDLSGATKLTMTGNLIAKNQMVFDLSGASQMSATGNAPQLVIETSGAAMLTLKGEALTANLEASGASKVDMREFVLRKVNVDVSGASKLNLNVSEEIEGEVSGASKVIYKGAAATRVEVSGASKLKAE